MTEITKNTVEKVWSLTGDIVAPTDGKISTGWAVEAPARQHMNWWQNRADNNIAYMMQHGIPEWDSITEYISQKSYVQYNGNAYKAIATSINIVPGTDVTRWSPAIATPTVASEALKTLPVAADTLPYFNGSTTAAVTPLSAYIRTLLDDVDAAGARATLGAQASDATLTALAGVNATINKLPYFTGTDTADVTDITTFGRSLIDDANASAARATLGLGTAATATVTTSTVDTTASRLLKVGDFGVGAPTAITNPDTLAVNGVFVVAGGTGTLPLGFSSGSVINFVRSVSPLRISQILQGDASGRVWIRGNAGGDTLTEWKELWSEINLIKTVSPEDATAGRMLQVGDFGLGSATAPYAPDLNVLTVTGFYRCSGSGTNAPNNNSFNVIHQRYGTSNVQIATNAGSVAGKTYVRTSADGVWGDWQAIWTTDTFDPTLKADLASPALTGTPTAPTAAVGTNTTQIATTAHVRANAVVKDSATGAATLPVGTTAQRPTAATGKLRFNSSTGRFEGYGVASWGSLGGATGGGNDDVFYENSQTITTSYTLTTGKNAMSAGRITINDGATVTIPDGASWSIV